MWCWVQETAYEAIAEVGGGCEAGPGGCPAVREPGLGGDGRGCELSLPSDLCLQ